MWLVPFNYITEENSSDQFVEESFRIIRDKEGECFSNKWDEFCRALLNFCQMLRRVKQFYYCNIQVFSFALHTNEEPIACPNGKKIDESYRVS